MCHGCGGIQFVPVQVVYANWYIMLYIYRPREVLLYVIEEELQKICIVIKSLLSVFCIECGQK